MQPHSVKKRDAELRRFWHKKAGACKNIADTAFMLSSVENLRDRGIRRQDHRLIIAGHGSLQCIQASDEGIEILFGFIGIGF